MDQTSVFERAPISETKKTKILVTIGPATDSYEKIVDILNAGANGFRINFSHADFDIARQRIEWIQQAREAVNRPVAIVFDTHGPKMQLGSLENPIEVKTGDELKFYHGDKYHEESGLVGVRHDLSMYVEPGEKLLIGDGRIHTVIEKVEEGIVTVKVQNEGKITSNKGINLPDTHLQGGAITDWDRQVIEFGAKNDMDYVAVSYIQSADDVRKVRGILDEFGSDARIISKIETKASIDNLEEILKLSDGVMIARGDLAIETAPETVPVLQRKIIGMAQEHNTISIVATHMLASMTDNPSPTRAEVSDVATATIVGADCVMLSEETAVGKHPVETVDTMKKIIYYTQQNAPLKPEFFRDEDSSIAASISSAINTLAHQVKAAAIVAETATGRTALSIAARRPSMPIIIVSDNRRVAMQMSLVYGGKVYLRPAEKETSSKLTNWLKETGPLKSGDIIVTASGRQPGVTGGTDTIKVRVLD